MLERQSALAGALAKGGAGDRPQLRLGEVRGWSLVQVAAFATTLPDLAQVIEPLLGAALPPAGVSTTAGARRVFKTGPEQFWIIGPDADHLAAQLAGAVRPETGAVTPLSHSRTRIFVEGPTARDALAKGIPLDLHPDVFRLDDFALTGLHHTPILIHRSAPDRYELYAMRTFAASVWDWLTDAALPFGCEVTT